MSHKHLILDRNPFTNEAMAGDLAVLPDLHTFLDLHERPDLRVVPDLAAIEIHEAVDLDVPTKLNVWRDQLMLFQHARLTSLPLPPTAPCSSIWVFFYNLKKRSIELPNVCELILNDLIEDLEINVVIEVNDAIAELDHRDIAIPTLRFEQAAFYKDIDHFRARAWSAQP
jgi:hypothetical protein